MNRQTIISALCCLPLTVVGQVTMNIDLNDRGPTMSDYQYGIFYEEINHAGEGGLYAEMVCDRSFEGGERENGVWTTVGSADTARVSEGLLNNAQRHAMRFTATHPMSGIANRGFWGMSVERDSIYELTFWATKGAFTAQLQSADGSLTFASAEVKQGERRGEWRKYSATLKANASCNDARLALLARKAGRYTVDVVSLFPGTFRNRPNGLRRDLAERLAGLHPTFVRFPGGCYVEGVNSYDEAFQWKRTLGPIEERPGHQNRNWNYWVSDGMGYHEFLQLCDDLNAAPLFVINVGLGHEYQIPVDSIDWLIEDALDAIEYANGDLTTRWGKERAKNGHPEPFNLKFIEIGNENYQADARIHSQQYAERYIKFYKAIKERYPELTTIGNVDSWGHDNPVWRNLHPVEMVDEHYYRWHTWMRENYRKYDNRMRNFLIYNGEYAANGEGKALPTMESAVGEAIYMMGMERNADICRMASFAPIFMNVNDPRWKYDMIYYDSQGHWVTPSYYVQQMMAENVGRQVLRWTESGNSATVDSATAVVVKSPQWLYQSVTVNDDARTVYLKIANPNDREVSLEVNWSNVVPLSCELTTLSAPTPEATNSMEQPEAVSPRSFSYEKFPDKLKIKPYSVNVFRVRF